jgi:hypothetical protein
MFLSKFIQIIENRKIFRVKVVEIKQEEVKELVSEAVEKIVELCR